MQTDSFYDFLLSNSLLFFMYLCYCQQSISIFIFRLCNYFKEKRQMILNRYELMKAPGDYSITVGFGSYGQVKMGIDKKTGKNVAIKIIRKQAKNQVVVHQQLYHPNIIKLLDYFVDAQSQTTYMILQYADGGTLFDKIRSEVLSKKQIKSYFKDVCDAISYMHGNQVMHRDIKPQNILLTSKGKAKLCDFGFAAILGERKTLCGTYEYMSPEMVQNKPYDYKIDIWALGILLFEMISGKAPFKGSSPQEVLDQMKTKIFFNQRFTQQEINLVKSILRVTPHKRPTIKQILQHPYFNSEDASSTKQSQVEVKQAKQLKEAKTETSSKTSSYKSQKTQATVTVPTSQQPNISKPQQNSYPFYAPKTQQQATSPLQQQTKSEKQPQKSNISQQSIQRPISNIVLPTGTTSNYPSMQNNYQQGMQSNLPINISRNQLSNIPSSLQSNLSPMQNVHDSGIKQQQTMPNLANYQVKSTNLPTNLQNPGYGYIPSQYRRN